MSAGTEGNKVSGSLVSRYVKGVLAVIAIGLWIVVGVSGFIFFASVLNGVWSAAATNPSRDAMIEKLLNIGQASSGFAVFATIAALLWPKRILPQVPPHKQSGRS